MGANKNPKQQPQQGYGQNYGPNPGQSSSGDPKGRSQNQVNYQQQRYESQQGPMAAAMGFNYGRGSEADYGNYTDIMNQYRNIYSGGGDAAGGGGDGGGGGGGGGGYSAFTVNPERVGIERVSSRALNPLERVTASDPYNSYGGYQEFSQTGGYSPQDISNMRARGTSPIRAAYANAERNLGQQRTLQGGYSPNAAAAQIKMAREQGQGMADAAQNVEAGIAQQRQQGRLSGLGGMKDIEGARQQAQMEADMYNSGQAFQGQQFDIGNENQAAQFNAGNLLNADQFNANLNYQGQEYNANAQAQAQAANNAAGQASADRAANAQYQNTQDRLAALSGARTMYGTTPGMTDMFGNQLINAVGQGGNFGLGLMNAQNQGQNLPGAWERGMGRMNDVMDIANTVGGVANAFRRQQPQTQTSGGYQAPMPSNPAQGFGGVTFGQPSQTQQRRPGMGGLRF